MPWVRCCAIVPTWSCPGMWESLQSSSAYQLWVCFRKPVNCFSAPMWEGDYWHSCVGVLQWCAGIWSELDGVISRLLRNTVWKNFRECVERGYGVDWKGREEFSNTVNWGGRGYEG